MDTIKQVYLYTLVERENYRQSYDQEFVTGMASDMASAGFKIEFPITVYDNGDGTYTIIDGHTRRQAALLGSLYGLIDHKAMMLIWIVIKDKPSDAQFKLQQLAANEKRVDPDDISKAIGYQQALSAGATIQDLIDATGHKQDYIERRLALLTLTGEIQALVAKRQLSILYAVEIARLAPNFQRIAIKTYNDIKSPSLDEFRAFVNELYTKQTQCTLFDLPMFDGVGLIETLREMKIEKPKSRVELEAELESERKARQADRAFAINKYRQLMTAYTQLKAQVA